MSCFFRELILWYLGAKVTSEQNSVAMLHSQMLEGWKGSWNDVCILGILWSPNQETREEISSAGLMIGRQILYSSRAFAISNPHPAHSVYQSSRSQIQQYNIYQASAVSSSTISCQLLQGEKADASLDWCLSTYDPIAVATSVFTHTRLLKTPEECVGAKYKRTVDIACNLP